MIISARGLRGWDGGRDVGGGGDCDCGRPGSETAAAVVAAAAAPVPAAAAMGGRQRAVGGGGQWVAGSGE